MSSDLVERLRELAGELAEKWEASADDVREAADIIEKLPVTADGVPVVPGADTVFRVAVGDEHDHPHYVIDGVEKSINWRGWAATFPTDITRHPDWVGGHDPHYCYSTREAALASTKGGK